MPYQLGFLRWFASKSPEFVCKDEPIENQRPLKIRVIGAGYSGVYLGIRIPQRLRNVDLQIYEKNKGIGGTWWENRYPGCACDIPAHSYQYSFAPNKKWSSFYAPSEEICTYIQNVAQTYGATRFIKLQHEVTRCRWDDTLNKWHLTVQQVDTGEIFTEDADVVISAKGNLNQFAWPSIPGIDMFEGEKMHSAQWNQSYDFQGKKIGIIGGGSSAIQIVPRLQAIEGTTLSCFVRSKTWVSNRFGDFIMNQMGWDKNDLTIGEERVKQFEDEDYYLKFRKLIEADGNLVHESSIRGSSMQKEFVKTFTDTTKERLASRPDLTTSFMPEFGLGCRRLTPGPGYLEAMTQDNVELIKTGIASINKKGLKLQDGRQVDVDVLACATGFTTTSIPPFKVVGKNGQTLQQRFTPFPETYLTITVDNFPNYFIMLGPNAGIGAGSLTVLIEAQGDYIIKCLRKLQKEDYAWMMPKTARVKDFSDYVGDYFKKTVYMEDCQSWYKTAGGNRISALWPGSILHAMEAWRSPRWEDFEYGSTESNQLRWLGNGWSICLKGEGDPSFYLNPDVVDMPVAGKPELDPKLAARPYSN
ncbi:hypothetical protein BKA56DRAFT_481176 [Ilyonectria sp. MPI-CAGE-AT-0026]|nr:hypothetical protein BKA56DRAFT_481176 [Ilyonectria sp. MPI-CAGE-AT-0026]